MSAEVRRERSRRPDGLARVVRRDPEPEGARGPVVCPRRHWEGEALLHPRTPGSVRLVAQHRRSRRAGAEEARLNREAPDAECGRPVPGHDSTPAARIAADRLAPSTAQGPARGRPRPQNQALTYPFGEVLGRTLFEGSPTNCRTAHYASQVCEAPCFKILGDEAHCAPALLGWIQDDQLAGTMTDAVDEALAQITAAVPDDGCARWCSRHAGSRRAEILTPAGLFAVRYLAAMIAAGGSRAVRSPRGCALASARSDAAAHRQPPGPVAELAGAARGGGLLPSSP